LTALIDGQFGQDYRLGMAVSTGHQGHCYPRHTRPPQIATQESTRTTQLYNRTADTITLDEIDRVGI
jgi:hypothetical protein